MHVSLQWINRIHQQILKTSDIKISCDLRFQLEFQIRREISRSFEPLGVSPKYPKLYRNDSITIYLDPPKNGPPGPLLLEIFGSLCNIYIPPIKSYQHHTPCHLKWEHKYSAEIFDPLTSATCTWCTFCICGRPAISYSYNVEFVGTLKRPLYTVCTK